MVAAQMLTGVLTAVALSACTSLQHVSAAAPTHDRPVSLFTHPWVWTDERGEAVTFSRWRGEPLVVTAVYTECKANCPRTLGKLRAVYAAFRREGRSAQFLLVTLRPASDTPERLRRFKQSAGLPESWRLLWGNVDETHEFTDLLDIHVLDAGSHLVHDARIVVFDPEGIPVRSFGGRDLDEEAGTL
jgi:protein SCO1